MVIATADTVSATNRTSLRLPAIIGGTRVHGTTQHVLEFPTGATVRVPELDAHQVEEIAAADRHLLQDVPLDEIAAFLRMVGNNWRSREYARRRLFVSQQHEVLGLSKELAESEADFIALYLSSHTHLLDQVAVELGHRQILDRWIVREDCEMRAYPVGLVAHTLAGNVPMSCVVSMVRALITKNTLVAKPATGDPITPISLALSFLDVDPDHPVARSCSVVYWPQDSAHGAKLLAQADALCAWGSADAMEAAHRQCSASTRFLPFGPRRSVALVGADADLERAAVLLAHDVSRYDQGACFSVHQAFVEEAAVDGLMKHLPARLDEYTRLLPMRVRDADEEGRRSLAHLEEELLATRLVASAQRSWAVAVCEPQAIIFHPLRRMLYLHSVPELQDALHFIDPNTQTVAVYPHDRARSLRDEIGSRGASRIIELGMTNFFRLGGTHDGLLPLQHLVRYTAVESPSAVIGKGALRTLDQHALLVNGGRVTDLLP
jgi:long-chain-fatty-acyl-CoA reductase